MQYIILNDTIYTYAYERATLLRARPPIIDYLESIRLVFHGGMRANTSTLVRYLVHRTYRQRRSRQASLTAIAVSSVFVASRTTKKTHGGEIAPSPTSFRFPREKTKRAPRAFTIRERFGSSRRGHKTNTSEPKQNTWTTHLHD